MTELLRVAVVFALVLALLRLKWNLGVVMLIGAAALGLLTGLGPARILEISYLSCIDTTAVALIVALALIMVLESILRRTETITRLVSSLKGLLGDSRIVMALMPAIIGILPSPGGAYFSAPLVDESAKGAQVDPARKSFINHWFRHIWEYISPLYPGFIMTAAITGVSMGRLFMVLVAFPLTVLATGALLGFRGVEKAPPSGERKRKREELRLLAVSFSPILAVMLLVMVFGVNIAVAMVAVVAGMFLYFRYSPARVWETLKESVSLKTLLLVLGVLVFKGMVEGSHAVEELPEFFRSAGVPVGVIIFVLPFLVGMMTGITLAYVGVTFPMLLPLIGGQDPSLGMLAFAYAAGFAGVMFSPVHLCLVLTRDYFSSELFKIYRLMLIPEGTVLLVALVQMLVLARLG